MWAKFRLWVRSLSAWRQVGADGAWVYCENGVTGQRKAVRVAELYSPLRRGWLRDGDKIVDLHDIRIVGQDFC